MAKNEQQGLSIVTSPLLTLEATPQLGDIDIIVPAGMICEIHAVEIVQKGFEADNAGDTFLDVEIHMNQTATFVNNVSGLSNDCIARGTMGCAADVTANVGGYPTCGMGYRAFPLPIMTAKGQIRLVGFCSSAAAVNVIARLYVNFVTVSQQRLLEVLGKE